MTLTSDQIKSRKRRASTQGDAEGVALCDLALSAFDMRERAAQCAEDWHFMTDNPRDVAAAIRALPIPEGADQRGELASESEGVSMPMTAKREHGASIADLLAGSTRAPDESYANIAQSRQQASRAEQVPAQAQRAAPSPVQHPEPALAREPATWIRRKDGWPK